MTPETWVKAFPLLLDAVLVDRPPSMMDEVKRALLASEAQLWMGEETAVVTQVVGDDLHVWLYGGTLSEMKRLFESARAWGLALGLTRMTVDRARKGWARALKPLGFVKGQDVDLYCLLEG